MNNSENIPALSRRANTVLIGLFMTILWLPTLDTFFHLDWTLARSENRALAAFPKTPSDWHELRGYVAGLEAYFNDHFGCRKCLVQWYNKVRWSVFRIENTRNVLVGKDGWLFYTQAEMIDHYSGLLQFTPEQLHDWKVLLEKRRDWLVRRGIAYLFVVTPDKHTIYPEELPDWVKKVRPQTKLDQFVAYMRTNSTVPVLDQREVLIQARQTCPTYYKTDVHWNFFGGFVAYQQLVQTLAKQRPGLEPLPLTAFTLTNAIPTAGDFARGGDMARMLGLTMIESNYYTLTPKIELPQFTFKEPPPERVHEPRFTNNPQAKGRMIIFHDSFALNWIQFLGYQFNQVTYLWKYDLDPVYVERDKPDIVVNEMNERFFNTENPAKLMAKEALN
jgi:alginate O-acetyltransferase complex protein AlgJ